MRPRRYLIVLFCNNKRVKVLGKNMTKEPIIKKWNKLSKEKKPKYTKEYGKHEHIKLNYELGLLFPNNSDKKTTIRDNLGRLKTLTIDNNKYMIKKIIPYWYEEKIYDSTNKKLITYDLFLEYLKSINKLSQIFSLNINIFVETDGKYRHFSTKNKKDSHRLIDIITNDLYLHGKNNFLISKDVNTVQRIILLEQLNAIGYSKDKLNKHYSY